MDQLSFQEIIHYLVKHFEYRVAKFNCISISQRVCLVCPKIVCLHLLKVYTLESDL